MMVNGAPERGDTVSRVLDTVDKGIEVGGGVLPTLRDPVAIAFIICTTIFLLALLAAAAWWWRRHDRHEEGRNDLVRTLVEKSTAPPPSTDIDNLTRIVGHFVEEGATTSRAMAEAIDRLAEYQARLATAQTDSVQALRNLSERLMVHESTAPNCNTCPRPLAPMQMTKTGTTERRRRKNVDDDEE